MQLNDAIKTRLENIMSEKSINSRYKVSRNAGLDPTLLTDFFNNRTAYPRIDTLYFICEGLNMTLGEFFNDPLFNIENIDEEKDSK